MLLLCSKLALSDLVVALRFAHIDAHTQFLRFSVFD